MSYVDIVVMVLCISNVKTGAENIRAFVFPDYSSAGDVVHFSCDVPDKGTSTNKISWTYNETEYLSDCDYNTDIGEDISQCWCDETPSDTACPQGSTNVTFQLTVTQGHFGVWTCDFPGRAAYVSLNEFVASTPPVLDGPTEITEGNETTFRCTSNGGQPAARFQWYRFDGSMESNLTDLAISDSGSSELVVTPDREYTDDQLICKVVQVDHKQPQNVTVTVTVNYVPSVELQIADTYHSSYNVTLGNRLEFSCYWVEGHPRQNAVFLFYKNNLLLKESVDNVLTIEEVSESDDGEFECFARNNVGSSDWSATNVTVVYSPKVELKINLKEYSPTIQMASNTYLLLQCDLIDANPVEATYYTFYKDNSVIQNASQSATMSLFGESNTVFKCTGTNTVGEGAASETEVQNIDKDGVSTIQLVLLSLNLMVLMLLIIVISIFVVICVKKPFRLMSQPDTRPAHTPIETPLNQYTQLGAANERKPKETEEYTGITKPPVPLPEIPTEDYMELPPKPEERPQNAYDYTYDNRAYTDVKRKEEENSYLYLK